MKTPEPSAAPPPRLKAADQKFDSLTRPLAHLLSVFLLVFLVDAAVSLVDSSLILLFNRHPVSILGFIVSIFAVLLAVLIYVLMGLTPLIPKRQFIPLTLFTPLATFAVLPLMIYCFNRLPLIAWSVSLCQVILGLWVLVGFQGGLFKFHWPLVSEASLGVRRFSGWNLAGFVLVNVFVLVPATLAYLFALAVFSVSHFTDGFATLHLTSLNVSVQKYVRSDGKTIQLFPMSHVADAAFYHRVASAFPTNSMILMEGVTDEKNLLTNKINYVRMASALGVSEQHEKFDPTNGVLVAADIDVDQFTTNTLHLLNLIMFVHTHKLDLGTMQRLMQYPVTPDFLNRLDDDFLRKRNEHLLVEIHDYLPQTEHIIVPWGVAHMAGISKEIQKSGFRLIETQEYVVIKFGGSGNKIRAIQKR